MNITVNLHGLEALIDQLNDYANSLDRRVNEICRRLAQYGLVLAEARFGGAIYDGTPDWRVEVEERDGRFLIVATGTTVLFMEFGTGVYYPDDHPQAAQFGMVRGGYGKGHGNNNTWGYYGEPGSHGYEHVRENGSTVILTHGNPANMPMYNTGADLKSEVERVAREVFST